MVNLPKSGKLDDAMWVYVTSGMDICNPSHSGDAREYWDAMVIRFDPEKTRESYLDISERYRNHLF